MNPALIKLEREISSIADRIHRRTHFKRVLAYVRNRVAAGLRFSRRPLLQIRNALAAGLQFSRRELQIAIAYSVNWARISVVSLHRLASAIRIPSQPRARPRARAIRIAAPASPTSLQTIQPSAKANTLERVFISVCFGLLIVAGILVAVLYLQVKALKTELAMGQRRVAVITARVNQLEKNNQQKPGKDSAPTDQLHAEIALSKADLKVIRQFIKVLPAAPGAEQKIHVGDDVSNITAVPVPESLVEQLPKLRGARFSIDQSGVIVLIGEGSKKADAIVTSN